VLGDDRFSRAFVDPEFAIDKNSEHYKIVKPTESTRYGGAAESDEEDQAPPVAQRPTGNLNNLFAGKDDEESVHGD